MSDLRQALLKDRIARLPHLPAISPNAPADPLTASSSVGARLDPAQPGLGALREEGDPSSHPNASRAMPPPSQSLLGSGFQPSGSSRSGASQTHMRGVMSQVDYSPLTAQGCFEQALEIELDVPGHVDKQSGLPSGDRAKASFRVYYTPPLTEQTQQEPTPHAERTSKATASTGANAQASFMDADLHNLQPTLLADENDAEDESASRTETPAKHRDTGTVFVLIHGAGYSALSFALVAKAIKRLTQGRAGVLAVDCRGHGRTRLAHEDHALQKNAASDAILDMSLGTIALDLARVIGSLFQSPEATPGLVLVGHSMGGSVAVEVASLLTRKSATATSHAPASAHSLGSYVLPANKIQGVAVLDVVEGTAMAALDSMKSIILAQPTGFATVEEAIRWHVESGTVINPESARRSVPSLLRKSEQDIAGSAPTSTASGEMARIAESDEEAEEEAIEELSEPALGDALNANAASSKPKGKPPAWVWVHDLLATSAFWSGWFTGLSAKFLSVKAPRLLLLAGTDRLDKELMIGQMQGKYQLTVFPEVGHNLQEDAPERTAQTLVEFWKKSNAPPPISSLSKFKPGLLPGAAPATFMPALSGGRQSGASAQGRPLTKTFGPAQR